MFHRRGVTQVGMMSHGVIKAVLTSSIMNVYGACQLRPRRLFQQNTLRWSGTLRCVFIVAGMDGETTKWTWTTTNARRDTWPREGNKSAGENKTITGKRRRGIRENAIGFGLDVVSIMPEKPP